MLHIQRLREEARKLGYRVERQPEEEAESLPQEFSCERDGLEWRWLLGDPDVAQVQAVLDALPGGIKRIDRQSFSVLVYWIEPDSIDTLLELDQALAPLRQSSAG
jgi:hypothetical protein